MKPESPFFSKGTLIGKRTKEKHITLQNLYHIVNLLIKKSELAKLPKEKILNISLFYFNLIREILPEEWNDYKNSRLTHIVCLNALAIVGNELINNNYLIKSQLPDSVKIANKLTNIKDIDWSSNGDLKFIKGMAGTRLLARDIKSCIK